MFLSNGDFIFPFDPVIYWVKHFYIWSFQNGALNPDGIIRFPSRILHFLVYGISNNLIFEYAYIASSILFAVFTFWFFCKTVLKIKNKYAAIIASLFFAINPIFLGNISKIGLVLAVATLPLCLALLYKGMNERRMLPFIYMILCLNIALVHPYTFTVNVLILIVFFLYFLRVRLDFVRRNVLKFIGILVLAIGLHAYFILPILSIGTLSKDALADNIQSTPTDYTKLVDIANTGDIFTGLSLSKNVLKDYEFYNSFYEPVYFIAIFLLYGIMFWLYIHYKNRYSVFHTQFFLISVVGLLVLTLLATVNFLHVDVLIKQMINLPAGWMFRSPLKWQLYIPFFLFVAFAISLNYISFAKKWWHVRTTYIVLATIFVLVNGYISVDVYNKLLTPQVVSTFSSLLDGSLKDQNMLYVTNGDCSDYSRRNSRVISELNQMLLSENVQVKRVSQFDFDSINVGAYKYVLSCMDSADEEALTQKYNFSENKSFVSKNFILYKNNLEVPYMASSSSVAVLDTDKDVAGKYNFIMNQLGRQLPIVQKDDGEFKQAISVQDPFDSLTPENYKTGSIKSTITPVYNKNQQLMIRNDTSLFYVQEGSDINLSITQQDGMKKLDPGSGYQQLDFADKNKVTISYSDPNYDYQNVISNGSFENGLWKQKVDDCYAYDTQPSIGLNLDSSQKTAGKQSMRLWARKHNACTSMEGLSVKGGEYYLLSFDYKGSNSGSSGYSISFNGSGNAKYDSRLKDSGKWSTFTRVFRAPDDAQNIDVKFYAFPNEDAVGTANYDNVKLVKIPDVLNKVYLTSGDTLKASSPKIKLKSIDPTKKEISISSARSAFYLSSLESYQPLWHVHTSNSVLPLKESETSKKGHLRVNSSMNGWYIDPKTQCENGYLNCTKNKDGTYDILLTMEFIPQRWFYLGLLITSISLTSVIIYVVRSKKKSV